MTDATLAIIVPPICTLLGSIVLYFQSKWNAKTANDKADVIVAQNDVLVEKAVVADVKADTIVGQGEVIHSLTNSTLSKTEKALELSSTAVKVYEERIAGLEKLLATFMRKNGGTGPSQPLDAQTDRIEKTVDDTNVKVTEVKTHLGERVDQVEEKLDDKKDK